MAVEAREIQLTSVREEERLLGGDVVWWGFLLVVSVPVILFGLSQAPAIHGFFISHKDFLEQKTAIQSRSDESGTLLQNRAISFPNADDLSCHYHIPDC